MADRGEERRDGRHWITIRGAREHNLKNLGLRIPRDRLVVITGVSGSGKSTLAFDTLYAEGYRKYMESLSAKARQVLEQLPRPDVDYIEGLSPVIAIEQQGAVGTNPRSTVATATEVADYARLLWATCGQAHCPRDGARIERRSLDDCVARILQEPTGTRIQILAPWLTAKPSVLREELPRLEQRGFQRVRVDGQVLRLDEGDPLKERKKLFSVDIVVDRLGVAADQRSRIADSLELAFREGKDQAIVLVEDGEAEGGWREFGLSQHFACTQCGTVYDPLTPRHFSFQSADGVCGTCGGLGEVRRFNPDLLVPDPSLSVRKGALKPLRLGSKAMIIRRNALMRQLAEQLPFDPTRPWEELDEETRHRILHGTGDRLFHFKLKPGNQKPDIVQFQGVLHELKETFRTTSSDGLRARLSTFQTRQTCPDCLGQRLSAYSRGVTFEGHGFQDLMAWPIEQAWPWVRSILEAGGRYPEVHDALRGLEERLRFLGEVGLGYLTLERPYNSLSGGEAQRVRLATQLGMGLVGVVYVLDEPSTGLHPADNQRLLGTLMGLRNRGNAVIAVEHDEDTIRVADELIELGPGAGEAGGHLVFQGTPEQAQADAESLTGRYLSGRLKLERESPRMAPGHDWLTVRGAREHNLKGIDVAFPVGRLTGVCGVSGSGKSTLVNAILGHAAAWTLNGARTPPGRHGGIDGLGAFRTVIRVDQSPIGRSPRSNPASYVKLLDLLRDLFSRTPLSRIRGYKPSRFSFNVAGGRCERCKGDGQVRLDMQFMADAFVECPSCHGARFNRETLEVRFQGFNIAEVLELTVDDALRLFRRQPRILEKLELLATVGLGYLRLGQASNTLSGGEAQRIKLALELSRRQQGDALYLLDEPTTGLHWADIQRLMDLLLRLRDAGHTLIVIEHHPDVLLLCDWLVELGPEGGEGGGHLIFSGDPRELAGVEQSPTGRYLAGLLTRRESGRVLPER